jgi:transcriptional regulator with XRE-family HTH domain
MPGVEGRQQFGTFLRARRERVRPEQVGLPKDVRRRVPGLRREELAQLAGISTDYYVRLEQGRDHQPSQQVLEALARALRLDADASAHLFALAHPVPRNGYPNSARDERIGPGLQELLDSWTTTPALVHGRRLDVLASNALGRALSPISQPGGNMLRAVFLDDDVRAAYTDLAWTTRTCVAYFRASAGSGLDHPWFADLVRELSRESEEFRVLWAQHDVQLSLNGQAGYAHPLVGTMQLRYQTAAVGTAGQTLFVVHAEPDTPDAAALARLARMSAGTSP